MVSRAQAGLCGIYGMIIVLIFVLDKLLYLPYSKPHQSSLAETRRSLVRFLIRACFDSLSDVCVAS